MTRILSNQRIGLIAALLLGLPSAACVAQSASGLQWPSRPTSDEFRRIFVPEDRIDEMMQDQERFLPIPREEFEELVDADRPGNELQPVRITRAVLRAQLDGRRLIGGSAELEVQHTGDGPAWLAIETRGFAIANVEWDDERPTTAGIYYHADGSQAERGMIVDRSGTVRFTWTASGRRLADGTRFELKLPDAVTAELVIEAPAPVRLSAEGLAVISQATNTTGGTEYHLAVRGGALFSLDATPIDPQERGRFAVRHVTTYHVTPSATQIDSQLRIHPFAQSVREMAFVAPAWLQVLDLQLGGQSLAFTETRTADGSDEKLLTIKLAQPLPPGETELRIRGMATTELDQLTALPSVRVARSTWIGGTVYVSLDDELQMHDLLLEGFRVDTSRAGENTRDPQWKFEQSIPEARLQVRVGRVPKRLTAEVFTAVEIGREEVVADATVDLTADHGAESIVRGELAEDWELTSVESEPSGQVRSWSTDEANATRTVNVVLDRPVASQRPIRLRFKARRQRPPQETSFSTRRLAFLRFAHLRDSREWMAVAAGNTFEMFSDGTATPRLVTVDELPAGFRELTSEQNQSYLFAIQSDAEGAVFRTRPRSAEMAADVALDVEVAGSTVRYECRVRIEPRSDFVTRLGIIFSEPLTEVPQWQFIDRSGRELASEWLTDRDETDGSTGNSTGKIRALRWRLAQPQTEPFDLHVSFEHAWEGASRLVLAAVDAPGSQSGTVNLSADRSVSLAVENRGLEPLASESSASETEPGVFRSAYRFQPERILLSDGEAPLVIRHVAPDQVAPAAWIRSARLDSVYLPNGRVSSSLSMSLETSGPEQLDLHLPSVEQILYRTGGTAWRQVARGTEGGPVTIPLPGGPGPLSLDIRLSQRRHRLGSFASVASVPLRFSLPVGNIERHVWVPAAYRLVDVASPAERLLAGFSVLGDPLAETNPSSPPDGFSAHQAVTEIREVRHPADRGSAPDVVHVTTLRLWCVAMLAIGFLLGAYLGRVRTRWAVAAAAIGFCGALLLPPPIVPPVSALAWGCLAAVLLHMVLAPLASAVRQLVRTVARPQEMTATTAMLLLWLGMAPDAPSAESAEAMTDGSSSTIHRVFIPIDEDRQPTGEHVFVPEPLYASLLRRERASRAPLGQWLITRCRVRGALTEGSMTVPQPFSLLIELETFGRNAEVRLPLPREQLAGAMNSLRLDGATPASWWSEDRQWLYVRVPQPGPHHLELEIVPSVLRKAGIREASLPLVAAYETYVELSVPEDMPQLTFPGVPGEVRYVPAASIYQGHVGPIRQLVVNWPAADSSSTTNVPLDVLTWMYVQRTVTLIEQRLVIQVDEEPLYVDVVPPAGVRFLPSSRDLPYARISAADGGERVSLVLEAEEPGTVVVPLQFAYQHSDQASRVAVPRAAFEGGVQPRERWIAIQPAPDVALAPQPGTGTEAIEPEEFLDRWGPADTPPMLAYREPADASSWRIELEPQAPRVEASESTIVIAHPAEIEVRFRADCHVASGPVLVQQISGASGLVLSDIQVVQSGEARPVRWTDKDGGWRILLPEPISGSYTLLVNGTASADEQGNVSIPILSLDAVKSDAPRLTAARTPGTVLELERSDSLDPVSNASLPAPWQDDWHLHGQYTWSESSDPSVLRGKVGRAAPPRDVQTVTTLAPSLRGWEVDVHAVIRGIGQPLDRLVFIAPREWEGPFEVRPAARWRLVVQEEALHNRLVLRPLTAAVGEVHVTLRGRLSQPRRDLVRVPAIRLVEPAAEDGYVALPQTTSDQETIWEPQHLVPVDDPPDFSETIGDAGGWLFFRTSAEPATARVSLVEQSPSAPLISFAESLVRLDGNGRTFGEATFTLDPRGRRSCEVALPDGHGLLDVHVNGRRLSLYRAASGRWRVQLESSQLPQLITVTWQGETAAAGKTLELHAAKLLAEGSPIPVRETAWTVRSDAPASRIDAGPDAPPRVSGSMLAAVRTANLVESLDEIVPALVGSSSETWTRWLEFWLGRIAAAQDRYAVRSRFEPHDSDAAQAADTARQRLARIEEALPPPSPPPPASAAPTDESRSLSIPAGSGQTAELRMLGEGSIETIRVRLTSGRPDRTLHRALGTVLLGLVAGGLVRFRRGDRAEGWQGIEVLFGLLFVAALVALLTGGLSMLAGVLVLAGAAFAWKVLRLRRGAMAT